MLVTAAEKASAREEALERGHEARGTRFAKRRNVAAVRGALLGWRGWKERARRVERGWSASRKGLIIAAFVEWEYQVMSPSTFMVQRAGGGITRDEPYPPRKNV